MVVKVASEKFVSFLLMNGSAEERTTSDPRKALAAQNKVVGETAQLKKLRSIQNLGRVEMTTSPAFSCTTVCFIEEVIPKS